MSILDVLGIAPGWAAKLTPFFVGVLLLYVVLERERVDSIKYIVRRLDRTLDRLQRDVRRTERSNPPIKRDQPRDETYRSIQWKGMMFRSNTELRIAKALDNEGAFFFPPTKARLNIGKSRESREIDFLVFKDGRYGVLEVDGPYHSAALDRERDDLLRKHGFDFILRFDSERCYHDPQGVAREFLAKLSADQVVPETDPPAAVVPVQERDDQLS